jgi:osmoprotectant transport system ATP-binding protein
VISIEHLTKIFAGSTVAAVDDVSMQVQQGETLVLLGSSGSGKTTTLKMINRLIEPTSGTVHVDGVDTATQDLLSLRRSIGYVFQDIGLFPHMTIGQNTSIVPCLLGWDRSRQTARTREMLDLVGLDPDEFVRRLPRELSGGQQQRVGIARALASDPAYLLMDEPFGALDAVTRDQLQAEVLRIKRTLGKTIVFVTHDLFEAIRLGDRIGVMHEGRLEQIGTQDELVASPATTFVEDLFKQAQRQADLVNGEAS